MKVGKKDSFYDKAVKTDNIEEINKIYRETLELIPEVRRTLNTMNEYFWLGEGYWIKRKLLRATTFEEVDSINKQVEARLQGRANHRPTRNLYSPYKAGCLPTLNGLFN